MDSSSITSPAFQHASLRSERLRIVSLIIAITVMTVFSIVRNLLQQNEEGLRILPLALSVVGVLLIYELVMLLVVTKKIRTDREMPPWVWFANVVLEISLPTVLILIVTNSQMFGPYRALVAPSLLAYFFFIILATLRLSPALCILTGLLSAIEYMAVVVYTFSRWPVPPEEGAAFPLSIYITYAIILFVSGIIAGAVARQIRLHVLAALREAEARRLVERLHRDLEIARTIQQGLLPQRTPNVGGFEIAGWSKPADETGGDYYDWQELPGGRLVVSLADVTGHGIGPALVTAVCRAYSRACFLGEQDLGSLIDRVHRLLAEDLPDDRFVTFVAALLDSGRSQVDILSAGHGPIFVYSSRDNTVQTYNAHDIPFGVIRDKTYGPAEPLELASGDILVLITDGFFEWANAAGELFGAERLCECIRRSHPLSSANLIQKLYTEVLAFAAGEPQQDDLTAVVVKRT